MTGNNKNKAKRTKRGFFGKIDYMNWPWANKINKWCKDMKNKKYPLPVRVICLVIALFIVTGYLLWFIGAFRGAFTDKSTSTLQNNNVNIETNEGAIAVGDNSTAIVNVNKEAAYTWTNKDSWTIDTEFCHERCKYDVRLFFRAEGSVIPVMSCISIETDAYITSFAYNLWAPDKSVSDYFSQNNLKSGLVCFSSDIGRTPEIRIGFFDKPTNINAAIIDCKDLPDDIMPKECK